MRDSFANILYFIILILILVTLLYAVRNHRSVTRAVLRYANELSGVFVDVENRVLFF